MMLAVSKQINDMFNPGLVLDFTAYGNPDIWLEAQHAGQKMRISPFRIFHNSGRDL
jgi:hypothetical protein